MPQPTAYDDFIESLDYQLMQSKCEIWRNVQISSDREVALFATRVDWILARRIPVHMFVDYAKQPRPEDFDIFLEDGLSYSIRAFSKGPKLLYSSLAVVACIACDSATFDAKEFVTKFQYMERIRKKYWHLATHYYPVLYDLSTKQTYFWKGFHIIGAAVWPFSRKFIQQTVAAIGDT